MPRTDPYIEATKRWIERFVIGLELCPFASKPFYDDQIAYRVSDAPSTTYVIDNAQDIADKLSTQVFRTAFLIFPLLDLSFKAFYDFTCDLQDYIDQESNHNIVLVAFHPQFTYAGSDENDTTNATNRSPYPMIHFLTGESLDEAKNSNVDIANLLDANQHRLSQMSWEELAFIFSGN